MTSGPAAAQLTQDRTYYGVKRPIPMHAALPQGAAGECEIRLLSPPDGAVVEKASVSPGALDLAEKFPVLWNTSSPRLLYAQLVVGGTETGPAVVLQPMVSPAYARGDRAGNLVWDEKPNTYSGIRAYTDKHVIFDTSKGELELALRPDKAPNTVWNFRELVAGGFYTDIIFHRIIGPSAGQPGFVVQVGDPTGTGGGGPGYMIDLENSDLPHDFGVLSMARSQDPNTNGSQIFICLGRERTAPLDGKYISFGATVNGAEALRDLGAVPVQGDRPVDPPMLKSARLVDAPPYGKGPRPLADPGATPAPR